MDVLKKKLQNSLPVLGLKVELAAHNSTARNFQQIHEFERILRNEGRQENWHLECWRVGVV